MLNLVPTKWLNIIMSESKIVPTLAAHTSCLVLSKEIKFHPKLNIYKFPELSIQKRGRTNVEF